MGYGPELSFKTPYPERGMVPCCSKYCCYHLRLMMIIMHQNVIESNCRTLISEHGPLCRSGS